MPQLHERYWVVNRAELELGEFVAEWIQRHDLTYIETLQALQRVQSNWFKYALRNERHPGDPEGKADEA